MLPEFGILSRDVDAGKPFGQQDGERGGQGGHCQQLSILGVLLLTSKGAAAVTGGGFITLAATLSTTGNVPVEGLALLLGVDRFMSEARAITNLIGNAVATIVIARWDGALDLPHARRVLAGQSAAGEPAERPVLPR